MFVAAAALSVASGACVDLTPPPPLVADGGVDEGADAPPEAGPNDTGGVDAATDVAGEAAVDAAPDTADARPDTGADTVPDATTDTGADVPPSTLGMGLVAYWKLDESSGSKAFDATSNHNDAVIEGLPTFLSGSSLPPPIAFTDVGAFGFRGLDDATWVPPTANLPPNQTTFAVWVWFDSLTNRGKCGGADTGLQFILYRRNTMAANGLTDGVSLIKQADNKLAFVLEDGNGVRDAAVSTTAVQTGRWYHVAGSWDGSTLPGQLRIYVNGASEGPGATHSQAMAYDSAGRFWMARSGECKDSGLGVSNYDGKLAGSLDDVRVYSRVLSGAELAGLASGKD
jgi:hypothetical protein